MARYKKKSPWKKILTVALIAFALVALFLISFGVTSLILKANQAPDIVENETVLDASPTPKPTYEELEEVLKEKDDRILELETQLSEALEKLAEKDRPTDEPQATIAPQPTKAPVVQATKAPQPTAAPAPAATQAPVIDTYTGEIPLDFNE